MDISQFLIISDFSVPLRRYPIFPCHLHFLWVVRNGLIEVSILLTANRISRKYSTELSLKDDANPEKPEPVATMNFEKILSAIPFPSNCSRPLLLRWNVCSVVHSVNILPLIILPLGWAFERTGSCQKLRYFFFSKYRAPRSLSIARLTFSSETQRRFAYARM